MINIDALNDDEKLAALESIHKSIAESKEIQKKKITTNVEMILKALKKIEGDLKQRYDETGKLIANLKNGTDGRDGKEGRDGKDGRAGKDGAMGPRGYDGLPGRNGLDGEDGVSITDAHIDFDGSLIISLSSGRVINVGEVVTADIAERIKVITNGGGTSQYVLDTLASLQSQISSITSGLEYQGTWNASTNVPTLASSVGTAGYYYIVATAGSTNLNGITDWQIGDWAVFNGTVWQKIDQTNLVTSVAGRTGAIVLTTADIGGLGTIATQASSNVSITGGSITGITDLAIADGGTGQSTANAAFNALAPSQTSNSGKYLTTNGTDTSWATNASGTVTSVAASVPTFLSVSGSPITTSGTLAITLSGTALPTANGGTGLTSFTADGVTFASSTSALSTSSSLTFQSINSALTVSNGTTGNGYLGFSNSADGGVQGYLGDAKALITPGINSALAVRGETAILFGIASTENMRLDATGLGIGTTAGSKLDVKGTLRLSGSTSGYVGLAPAAAAGSTTYTLPSADGTSGQSLTTNGSGTLSWASGSSATVTSVAASGGTTGLTFSGSPITTSGTLTLGGTLAIANGGTGQTTANAAFNALVPSQTGNSGKYLTTDGTDTSWATNPLGTVTSVAASVPTFLSITGSPITTSGTLAISLSGTALPTTSGGTGLTSFTANGVVYASSTSALATGSALTFDGTTLTANTIGAFTLSGTIAGGGNQINNVIIGASTPLAGSFTTLSASGGITSTGNGDTNAVRLTSTTVRPGGFQIVDTDDSESMRVYLSSNSGNGRMVFAVGTGTDPTTVAERMSILTSNGNVGIGTSLPSQKLQVNGTGRFYKASVSTVGAVASSGLLIDGAGANGNLSQIGFGYDASLTYMPASIYGITTTQSGNTAMAIGFATRSATTDTAPTEVMRLDTSGNLGLGVTPSAWQAALGKVIQLGTGAALVGDSGAPRLRSIANAYFDGSNWRYIADGYATYMYQNGSTGETSWNQAVSGTAGNAITFTQAMTLDASGNLGVGTTSPARKLHVVGQIGSYHSANDSQTLIYNNGTVGSINVTYGSTGSYLPLTFLTSDTERARIDTSGNLLVGTTSGYGGPGRINVGFNQTTNFGITLRNTNVAATGVFVSFENSGGTGNGSISQTNSTTIAYNTSSDRRLKTNISLALSASSDIDAIQVVSHGWVSNNDIVKYGVIAQDLELVAPQAITKGDDGEEIEKVWGVDYSKLVPMLVKEIQSLRKRLADAGI